MKKTNTMRHLLTTAVVGCLSTSVMAGGPLDTNPNDPDGVERWPNGGQAIPFNPDGIPAGGADALALGPLTYTEAVADTTTAFATWQMIPSATATYSNNGPMPFDVDVTNFAPFVDNLFNGNNNADGFSPIVYDVDGSIFVALFGVSGVLGFASTDTRDADGNPIEAVSFLNGGAINDGFPLADFRGVQFHEFGHYSGMGHTVVNGQNIALGDSSGPSPNNTYGQSPGDQTETMYPFALQGGGQVSPHADDIAYFSFMYPSATYFANSGTITGQILSPSGDGITGVNVIARNVENPFEDAVSAISGDRAGDGIYTLNGLTPGAAYTIHTDQILQGGFSTTPVQLPGPEEFYNLAESNDATADDPNEATPVVVAAGAPVENIDIIFNQPPPGSIPLDDDNFVQLFPSFPIGFCGQVYDSLFVNSNGSVSFGAGDGFFLESAGGMLAGPPRIAGLWDDLSPNSGGSVTFEDTGSAFVVRFENVPEFPATGANTFEIRIFSPDGAKIKNRFQVKYGDLTATDGLAGFSCGGLETSGFEEETDLSAFLKRGVNSKRKSAVYELFALGENDLANSRLQFSATTAGRDTFEPNNSTTTARKVQLPFNTIDKYSAIAEGDVDFYRFSAEAGTTLFAEVITGQIDTVMGLFRISGKPATAELIALDDDGGAGTLSALQVPIEETGAYVLAVSTFPDFDFVGAGFSQGRYVLDVETISGFLLNLGDDDSAEVDIGFDFPFNGTTYSSVFVNSNGNLTFGAGDTDFSESVAEFLGGAPRIAPLFDDLSPNQGGRVIVDGDESTFSVTFDDVPEFLAPSGNTFTVTLSASGDIGIAYGSVAAADGLTGVTEGNGAADPGEVDLTGAAGLSATGTTYELFFFGENDLTDAVLDFIAP
ncbi:MAG: carboxypeptidase-like regulatory domain-containing protein [Pseudomonadota bacterium]